MNFKIRRATATLLLVAAVSFYMQSAAAQKKGKDSPGDYKAEFKKIGAIYGGYAKNAIGRFEFQKGEKAAETGMVAFQLRDFDSGKLPTLPKVDVPVGIDFFLSLANDADLKQLATLKKLTVLNLGATRVTDAGLKELKDFADLTTLFLHRTKVTDKGLKELGTLKNLTTLDLEGNKITDAGLKELTRLKKLTVLNLDVTEVTDAGIKELNQMPNLAILNIGLTKVTDKGLKEIPSLKKLTHLNLLGAPVTLAGVQELEKAMPKCKIMR